MSNGYKHSFSTPQAGSLPGFGPRESGWGSLLADTRPASLTANVQADTSWGEIHYGFGQRGQRAPMDAGDAGETERLVSVCASYAASHGGDVDGTLFIDINGCR